MKIIVPMLAIVLGIALFVYGGYDDSPGAQGLGLLCAVAGLWRLVVRKKRPMRSP